MQKNEPKMKFWPFIEFGSLEWSDIAYSNGERWYSSTNNNQEVRKGHYLCIISIIYAKRAKNEVFGHLTKFGWFDMADIAYSDR